MAHPSFKAFCLLVIQFSCCYVHSKTYNKMQAIMLSLQLIILLFAFIFKGITLNKVLKQLDTQTGSSTWTDSDLFFVFPGLFWEVFSPCVLPALTSCLCVFPPLWWSAPPWFFPPVCSHQTAALVFLPAPCVPCQWDLGLYLYMPVFPSVLFQPVVNVSHCLQSYLWFSHMLTVNVLPVFLVPSQFLSCSCCLCFCFVLP